MYFEQYYDKIDNVLKNTENTDAIKFSLRPRLQKVCD